MKSTDRYIKVVLTVIAAALCVIAVQNVITPVQAVNDCGGSRYDPCYVSVKNWPSSMDVRVQNWP